MKRKDYLVIILLIALLPAWQYFDRYIIKKHFYQDAGKPLASEVVEDAVPAAGSDAVVAGGSAAVAGTELAAAVTGAVEAVTDMEPVEAAATTLAAAVEAPSEAPEQTLLLENEFVRITLSSRGGGVKDVTLKQYTTANTPDSGPVVLDFAAQHALVYDGVPGLGQAYDFTLVPDADGRKIEMVRSSASGLTLKRTLEMDGNFTLAIRDVLVNEGKAPVVLEEVALQTGPMIPDLAGIGAQFGMSPLGVDTLSPGGEKVQHWGAKIGKVFEAEQDEKGTANLPVQVNRAPRMNAVDWVAAKNKYFVQIITPEDGAEYARIKGRRELSEKEKVNPRAGTKMTPLAEVSVSAVFGELSLEPGQSLSRAVSYYVGPMKYDELHAMSLHRVDVMELGMWKPIGKLLLLTMNFIHDKLWPHNYGLAIMLLTIIIRILFWPVTHKSYVSMKRMTDLQPLMKEIQAKYKDDPKRLQAEMMGLYKKHKVNPLGGCLPMLIQIPVFIALFYVLRSAIELRYAGFLWIDDLSAPENLFAQYLPIPLNILPLLMTVTMYFQQKMTPTTGDPAQAKMMRIMMPGMMLFFLYSYASGLALYWTTQNLLMIVQQYFMHHHKKK